SLGEPGPASLSRRMVSGWLREEMGFDGVSFTDDLAMGAIAQAAGKMAHAARRAIAAGQDILLLCSSPEEVEQTFAALTTAVKQEKISEARVEQSLKRIKVLRSSFAAPVKFEEQQVDDISAQLAA